MLMGLYKINAQAPTITSLSPISGAVGDTITITGGGFNSISNNNIIFFGATRASVITSTAASLKVRVPIGATFSPISILNASNNLVTYSSQFFNPIYSPNKGSITSADLSAKIDYTTGSGTYTVVMSDIDGDGKIDLVVINSSISSNIASVFLNNGSNGAISFAPKIDFAISANIESIKVGDIDGDGKPDMIIINHSSNYVSVLRNTSNIGAISFSSQMNFQCIPYPKSIAIADINGDGKTDLALTNADSNTVSILRNTGSIGNLSFAEKIDFAAGLGPISMVIGDLDSDNKPDMVVANKYSNSVSVLRNLSSNGVINFAQKIDMLTGNNPKFVNLGDVDGNGKLDLAISNIGDNKISIFQNTTSNGNLSFALKLDFPTASAPGSLAIGDIDGDGLPDLVSANEGSDNVSVLRNISSNGSVNFETNVDFETGTAPVSVAIGDINGDGKPDLATANLWSNSVSVLRNNPLAQAPNILSFSPKEGAVGTTVILKGSFFNITPSNNIVFFGATKAIVTAASDSILAVMVPKGASFAPITVLNISTTLIGYSKQFFNPTFSPNKMTITKADMAPKTNFTSGDNPWEDAIGDIDGDGKPDLIVVNSGYFSNSVSVFRNVSTSGNIDFAPNIDFAVGTFPEAVAVGDLDGDGKLDIVVVNRHDDNISIFRNTSNIGVISFAPKETFYVSSYPQSIAIGDLNGDGKPDLAIANVVSNTVSVLRNICSLGSINFAKKIDYPTDSWPYSLVIGDLDGDGKSDLAAGCQTTVNVYRNIYNGNIANINFAPKVAFNIGQGPSSLVIGDLDGDNKLDFASANVTDNNISILRNTSSLGTISFDSITAFGRRTSETHTISIGDINGDGKLDLSISSDFNSMYVYCNTGKIDSFSWDSTVNFATGYVPFASSISDMDGDGKPDLVTINNNDNTISVIRNNPQFPRTINLVSSLTQFSSCIGKESNPQSFTISGNNLLTNLLIIPPNGYEVSTTSGSSFASSITLIPLSGTVNNTTIFIRLKSTASGTLIGNIACSSYGAVTQNLLVTGILKTKSTSINNNNICPNQLPYNWNGRTYNTAKTDTVFLTNSVGCDSLAILKLTTKSTSTSLKNINICPSELPYTWNGRIYNSAKTDTVLLTNSVGCDSLAILKLSIKLTSVSTNKINICTSQLPYTWNTRIYNTAQIDTVHLTNSIGCDSAAILNLIVSSSPNTSNINGSSNAFRLDTMSYSVIGATGSTFNWSVTNGIIQSGAGTNQIQVKWNAVGTDTLKVIETSSQGCAGIQNTLIVNVSPTSGINEINASKKITIYPNPTTGMVNISSSQAIETIEVFDVTGKLVLSHRNDSHQKHIELDLSAFSNGIYFIQTHNQNAEKTLNKVVISK